MNDDRRSRIICLAFGALLVLLMLVPFAGMLFGGSSGTSSENRSAAPFPAIVKDGGLNLSFGTEFEAWFGDRFALRRELIQADADLKLGVFNTSPEDSVIAGKEGWLFYADTVCDHCGEARLSELELRRLVTVIRLESEYARSRGAGYVFAAAPNKNSIYPEMMPDRFAAGEGEGLYGRLTEALRREKIPVADLKAALVGARGKGLLYYTGDSHWNLLGSNVAAEAIFETVKAQRPEFAEWSLRDMEQVAAGSREDDLLKMAQPLKPRRVEEYAADSSPDLFEAVTRMRSLDDVIIRTRRIGSNGADGAENADVGGKDSGSKLKLLAYRDSFGRALIKPLSESFGEAVFTRNSAFDAAGEIDENTVVLREIVERNLPDLLRTAPVIEAPAAGASSGNPLPEGVIKASCDGLALSDIEELKAGKPLPGDRAVWFRESSGGMIHYYGFVPAGNETSADALCGRIFVELEGGLYEAFPIIEERLLPCLEANASEICGFSFYLPEDAGAVEAVYY